MKITVNIPDNIVQSYLNEVNYHTGDVTKFKVKKLTPEQVKQVKKTFAEMMVGEVEMRTDDHGGFETYEMFRDTLKVGKLYDKNHNGE